MANPQMFVEVVASGGQAAVTVVGHGDDVGDAFGDDEDFVIVLNADANSANAAITDVLVGTPVTPILAANSAILSNTTASGDILFAVADGSTNSRGLLHLDGSSGNLTLTAGGSTGDVLIGDGDGTILAVDGGTGTIGINVTPLSYINVYADKDMGEFSTTARALQATVTTARTGSSHAGVAVGLRTSIAIGSSNDQAWTHTVGLRGVEPLFRTETNSIGAINGAAGFYMGEPVENGATYTTLYGIYMENLTLGDTNVGADFGNNSLLNVGLAGSDWDSTSLRNAGDYFGANGKGMVIGHTAKVLGPGSLTYEFQVLGTTATDGGMLVARHQASAGGPNITLGKSRDAIGTYSTVLNADDELGTIEWGGSDGTDMVSRFADITVYAAAESASNDTPGYMVFGTTADTDATTTERMRIDSAGRILIGHDTAIRLDNSIMPRLQISSDSLATSGQSWAQYSDDAVGPHLRLMKSRGALGVNTIVQDGDELGVIRFMGADGSGYFDNTGAIISVNVDGTPGSSVMPSKMYFLTSPAGSSTPNVRLLLDNAGGVFMGGETANTFMTTGLTINQGAADNEILAFKSSDVAHAMTDLAEADTYATFSKADATTGCLQIAGYSDGAVAETAGIILAGHMSNATSGESTSIAGAVQVQGWYRSGSTRAAMASDSTCMSISGGTTTRFLFQADGTAEADVEWSTYDGYDDLTLIRDMEAELLSSEDNAQTSRRKMLEETGIIRKDSWHMEDDKPRAFVNTTKLSMLHHGALMQAHDRIQELEKRLLAIEGAK